jgi:hypothetical protein
VSVEIKVFEDCFQFINNPVSCDGEIATHRKMLKRRDSVEAAERRDAAGEPNIQ